MKVLVTGAGGFVGKAICKILNQNSIQLIKLVRKNVICNDSKVEYVTGDITDESSINKIKGLGKVDAIIHAAGLAHQFGEITKEAFWQTNVLGSENIAKLAKRLKVDHFILISSVSVYGNLVDRDLMQAITEEEVCNPSGFYAESKYESELISRTLLKNTKTNLTILRLATVIGEEDIGNVYRLIRLIDSGWFVWIGKGLNRKSLIYKEDIGEAVTFLLKNKTNKTEVFNLTSEAISMKKIVATITKRLDAKLIPIHLPAVLINFGLNLISKITKINKIQNLEKSIKKWCADDIYSGKKIFKDYKFKPNTSPIVALEKEADWYLKNK